MKPEPKAQRNFTDPDSRIRPVSNKGCDQCGNAQVLVNESQLILAADVTQHANDIQQVEPLLDRMESHLQAAEIAQRPREFDAGDFSADNAERIRSHGMVPYLATQRLKHDEELPPVPRGRIPKSLTPTQRRARTLRTKQGRETYQKRKRQVEPPCLSDSQHGGQIKPAGGFRQFAMRELDKRKAEWQLVCLTHNLPKLWRAAPT